MKIDAKPDADAIELMLATAGWAYFERRMREMIEKDRDDLQIAEGDKAVYRKQGHAQALRDVLAVPSILIAESRDEGPEKR